MILQLTNFFLKLYVAFYHFLFLHLFWCYRLLMLLIFRNEPNINVDLHGISCCMCVLNFLPFTVNPTAKIHQMLFSKHTSILKMCATVKVRGRKKREKQQHQLWKRMLISGLIHHPVCYIHARAVLFDYLYALILFIKISCQTSVTENTVHTHTQKKND